MYVLNYKDYFTNSVQFRKLKLFYNIIIMNMNKEPFLTNYHEIYVKMLENYTKEKEKENQTRDLSKYSGIIIENNYDKEKDEDSLQNILLLLSIIKKEKGL